MSGDYHGYLAGTGAWADKELEDRVTSLEAIPIRTATVTLTDTDIKALPTAPVELVPAPGANHLLVPHFAFLRASLPTAAEYVCGADAALQITRDTVSVLSSVVNGNG